MGCDGLLFYRAAQRSAFQRFLLNLGHNRRESNYIPCFFWNTRSSCHKVLTPSIMVPRGCTLNTSHLSLRAGMLSLVHPGRSTWTEALMPVPRLVGQEWI